METVYTGWTDIPQLHYDADRQILTVVYASGEARVLTRISRSAVNRFLGSRNVMTVERRANAERRRPGIFRRAWLGGLFQSQFQIR